MQTAKKITVMLPLQLLKKAQRSTGEGVTSTIRQGLKLVAAGDAYDKFLALKGKIKLNLNLKQLRADK